MTGTEDLFQKRDDSVRPGLGSGGSGATQSEQLAPSSLLPVPPGDTPGGRKWFPREQSARREGPEHRDGECPSPKGEGRRATGSRDICAQGGGPVGTGHRDSPQEGGAGPGLQCAVGRAGQGGTAAPPWRRGQ